MPDREVRLKLQVGTDGPATDVVGVVRDYTGTERLRRAGMSLGGGLLAALLFLPIPIVHFAAVPGSLLVGIYLAVKQAQPQSAMRSVRGACPRCGAEQSFFTGLGLGQVKLPMELSCASCGRPATLREGPR